MTWDLIWWLVGTFGVAGAVALVLTLLGLWPVVIAFFTKTWLGRILAIIFTAGIAVLIARAKGQREGVGLERKRQEKEDDRFIDQTKQKHSDIDRASDDDLDRQLRDGTQANRPGGR